MNKMLKSYKPIALCLIMVWLSIHVQAQDRELRAAWVATVANIDWPRNSKLSTYEQKRSFTEILDSLQACNFNAIVVQIRPSMDAFYPSAYEPWSHYFSYGSKPPEPYYDPLQFMIDECRKRCIEFHAWINPLRAYNGSKNPHPTNHITYRHPEWFYRYGKSTLMNAGNPQAVKYLMNVIRDIISRYDIDALHMDDYFYPYTIAGKSIPDDREFASYNPGHLSRGDWRRKNIDDIIQGIRQIILETRPSVQLGISPFGVWRNFQDDFRGSRTRAGQTNYDNLYADIRKWMEKDWIDYCTPQLYWERGHKAADFMQLIPWWKDNAHKTHLYAGLQIYLMASSSKSVWHTTDETLAEIKLSRYYKYDGMMLYSVKYLMNNTRNIRRDLKQQVFQNPSLPPIHRHTYAQAPQAPKLQSRKTMNYHSVQVDQTSPGLYYILAYEERNGQMLILDKRRDGRFILPKGRSERYFVCAINKSQIMSQRVYF